MTLHQLSDGRAVLFRSIPASTYKVLYREGMLGPHIICMVERHDRDDPTYYLPDGKWQFVGTSDSLNEEQAYRVLSGPIEDADTFVPWEEQLHPDFMNVDAPWLPALESFASLLQSLNITGRVAVLLKSK